MADNEYRILVDVNLLETSEETVPTNQTATPEQTTKKLAKEASDNSSAGTVSKTIAVQMGKKALQYGIQNYGNLTGDYISQNNINAVVEVGSIVAMMATGPVGIAAAVGTVVLKSLNHNIDLSKKRRETEFLRERTGMTGMNGGRR